jgi:ribosomal protein S6--L-glutamate ligase
MRILCVYRAMNRETRHFIDAASGRGHCVDLLDATVCGVFLPGSGGLALSPPGCVPDDPRPDVALVRMPSLASEHVREVVRYVEYLGIPCVNTARALAANRDKAVSYAALAANGLPIPATVLVMPGADRAARRERQARLLSALPSPPWIVKLPDGSKGQGVMIAESLPALRSLLDAFAVQGLALLVQACVPEAMTANIRVLVFGGEAVAAVERRSSGSDFRANAAQGATGRAVPLNPELALLAERAAAAFGLGMAGIDMVLTPAGYRIIEVNSCPGFIGPQRNIDETSAPGVTRVDLAARLLDHLQRVAAECAVRPPPSPRTSG